MTRYYCHDARNQLITVRSAAGCSSGLLETYAYDAAGNRTLAAGRTISYDSRGQLAACTGAPACSPVFDPDGRLTKITTLAHLTWSYLYDGESRLIAACQSTACTGSGFARFDSVYDGEGHRIQLKETPAGGSPVVTTTDFRYEGDAVTSEVSTTGAVVITRTFTTDEAGAIIKVAISGDPVTLHNGDYLVTWNGHGDALALNKIETTGSPGSLTAANRVTYTTWGTPSVTGVNVYANLGFRYLYVGRFDVQWDNSSAVPAGLQYMHARHYSAEFGRFLQPDPAAAEANLYGYGENSPVTKIDPSGELCFVPFVGWAVCGVVVVYYTATGVVAMSAWLAGQLGARAIAKWCGNGRCRITLAASAASTCYGLRGPCTWLLTQNKQIRTRIRGLEEQIRKHELKLRRQPNHPDADHWRKEVNNLRRQVEDLRRKLPGRR